MQNDCVSNDVGNEDDLAHDAEQSQRRPRSERGLPSDEALRELARTYLEAQRRYWPRLAQDGTLPPAEPELLTLMASEFRDRFLASEVATPPYHGKPPWQGLACSYLRYSCDRSNPRSLDQQLKLQLERAQSEGHFIPWAWVFADAAVSGTTANRTGYSMAKMALAVDSMATMYIDEVGRASRDAIEALRLGRTVELRGRRLIGVSDGFDSASPVSKLMLSIYAMIQEWFVDQLRSKVNRGMDDAFSRGTNINKPPVGYRLIDAVDAQGKPMFGRDGARLKMKVINPVDAAIIVEAFERFNAGELSPGRLAIWFNEKRLGGIQNWTEGSVRQMLCRRTYMGLEIYHATYRQRDPETGRNRVVRRPRAEWKFRRLPQLQIVSVRTWKMARRRFKEVSQAFRKSRQTPGPTRCEVYPSVLIRPRCGCCQAELIRGRSGHYGSYCCANGVLGRRGCTARGYKSIRIVEGSILAHLRDTVIQPDFLQRVLEEANRVLREAAARPQADTLPLEAELQSIRRKRDRLVKLLERDDTTGLNAIVDQVARHERQMNDLRAKIADLKASNTPAPPPLTAEVVQTMLADLRGVLQQDVAVAAPILRELTGPITVDRVLEPGRVKPTWIARFTLQAVPALVKLTSSRHCPTTPTWEYLHRSGWTMPESHEVYLEEALPREKLAPQVVELRAKGASIESIAQTLGASWETVKAAEEVARRGGGRNAARFPTPSPARLDHKYIQISERVVALRDQEGLSFREISLRLGVRQGTATRAYNFHNRDDRHSALRQGKRINNPPVKRLPHKRPKPQVPLSEPELG